MNHTSKTTDAAAARARRGLRGTTLLEVMVVMAIVAIITAIAAPAMLPMLRTTQLQGAAAEVAAFIDVARRNAVTTGRCQRIVQVGNSLRHDERNSPDCVDLGLDTWTNGRRTYRPESAVNVQLNGQALGVTNNARVLIFRPSGRLRGRADLTPADEGVRVVVTVNSIPDQARVVRVTPVGRICSLPVSQPVPAIAAPLSCP